MNYSTAIFLINKNVRAIAATYEADTPTVQAPRTIFKTFDSTMEKGDYVIVPTNTRHNMTVCKVVDVDVEPDLESSAVMAWVLGTIDRSSYEHVMEQESRAIEQIKAAEKTHAREELRKKMLAHVDEAALGALQITRMSGDGIEVLSSPKV